MSVVEQKQGVGPLVGSDVIGATVGSGVGAFVGPGVLVATHVPPTQLQADRQALFLAFGSQII